MRVARGRVGCGAVLSLSVIALLAGCEAGRTPSELKLIEAEQAYERRDYERARAALDRYFAGGAHGEDRAAGLYLRALIDARTSRRDAAYASARLALQATRTPDTRAAANFLLGTLYFEDGDWARALQSYDAAIASGGPLAAPDVAWFRTGQCLERLGRWSEARPRFEAVVQRHGASRLAESARRRLSLNASHFAIQCGAFAKRENAEQLAATLRQDRLATYVAREARGGTTMHVVLVGRYLRYEEAQRALREVARFVNQPVIWP